MLTPQPLLVLPAPNFPSFPLGPPARLSGALYRVYARAAGLPRRPHHPSPAALLPGNVTLLPRLFTVKILLQACGGLFFIIINSTKTGILSRGTWGRVGVLCSVWERAASRHFPVWEACRGVRGPSFPCAQEGTLFYSRGLPSVWGELWGGTVALRGPWCVCSWGPAPAQELHKRICSVRPSKTTEE